MLFSLAAIASIAGLAIAVPATSPNVAAPNSLLDKRYNLFCGPDEATACYIQDAQACVNYLVNSGTYPCNGNEQSLTVLCKINNCRIYARAQSGVATSYCRDAGAGAQKIINQCNNAGFIRGSNAAAGNGNLIVTLRGD